MPKQLILPPLRCLIVFCGHTFRDNFLVCRGVCLCGCVRVSLCVIAYVPLSEMFVFCGHIFKDHFICDCVCVYDCVIVCLCASIISLILDCILQDTCTCTTLVRSHCGTKMCLINGFTEEMSMMTSLQGCLIRNTKYHMHCYINLNV